MKSLVLLSANLMWLSQIYRSTHVNSAIISVSMVGVASFILLVMSSSSSKWTRVGALVSLGFVALIGGCLLVLDFSVAFFLGTMMILLGTARLIEIANLFFCVPLGCLGLFAAVASCASPIADPVCHVGYAMAIIGWLRALWIVIDGLRLEAEV